MANYNDSPFKFSGQASTNDLIAGSWKVVESATPIDILDTNGSLGQVSASFGHKPQGVANTPGTAPVASSDFLQGQPYTFTRPGLGTMNGNILSATPQSSVVGITCSTPLNALNFTVDMPAYQDGQPFYSFTPTSPVATSVNGPGSPASGTWAMAVDASGNIWATGFYGVATGFPSGVGWVGEWDRFGNHLQTILIANGSTSLGQANGLGFDGSGYLYVSTSTQVHKFNAVTGAFFSTIISLSGMHIYKMVVDRSYNIWLATDDTTSSNAVKKYSTSGGSASGWCCTYSVGAIASNGLMNQYVGMSILPTSSTADDILVYNLAPISTGSSTMVLGVQRINASGFPSATSQNIGGISGQELTNFVGAAGYWSGSAGVSRMISQTGIWDNPSAGNALSDQVSNQIKAARGNTPTALAYDPNGFGMYVGIGSKIYRISAGNLSANQAIECYLGYAGWVGSITYGPNTPISSLSDTTYVFPGWNGNVWSRIKELCARVKKTITTDGTGLYITRNDNRLDQYKFSIDNREAPPQITEAQPGAQVIQVTSQNVVGGRGSANLYTARIGDSMLAVDASGVSTTTINANAYTTAIVQPVAVDPSTTPLNGYTGKLSIYAVVDSSNPPQQVPAATWTAAGGLVTAVSSATQGSIDISVFGPTALSGYTGPFQLGYINGPGASATPGLIIRGWGMTTSPQTVNVYTGAPISVVQQPVSQTMDSPFLDTLGAAYDMARVSATVLGHGEMHLQVVIPIADITVGFGKAVGGYFFWKRNYWRVTDIEWDNGTATLTAVRDTRVADVQDGSITHGTIDSTWSGFRYQDNYLSPGILGE